MIERLYVHNFRCFENFTLNLKGLGSVLVIGKNGSGKSTLGKALGLFQNICRGPNRVRAWIEASDFTQNRIQLPMRFEIDLLLNGKRFIYSISFEMPERFREARVEEEKLTVDGEVVFARKLAQVEQPGGSAFGLDWHVAALPLIKERATVGGSIQQLKTFLASIVILAPIPSEMSGYSDEESSELQPNAGNFSSWLNALLLRQPAAYRVIEDYLRSVIPDFESFENVSRGENGKQLLVRFKGQQSLELTLNFNKLSDGEKCFFLSALIVAYNKVNGPVFCLWDEPENHLSLPEIGHFITQLRKLSNLQGQLIATSHHPETIRRFSDENTIVLTRNSHLEPTIARRLSEYQYRGDLIEALMRNEVIE